MYVERIFPFFPSHSSKKVESEGGTSAAKKDSKRKKELSISDDVEVRTPPPSPPEEDDDDGVQVRAAAGRKPLHTINFAGYRRGGGSQMEGLKPVDV